MLFRPRNHNGTLGQAVNIQTLEAGTKHRYKAPVRSTAEQTHMEVAAAYRTGVTLSDRSSYRRRPPPQAMLDEAGGVAPDEERGACKRPRQMPSVQGERPARVSLFVSLSIIPSRVPTVHLVLESLQEQ
jgi:hypothetical protein